MSSSIKPSDEAKFVPENANFQLPSHIDICGITFAKYSELNSSFNQAYQKTDVHTLSQRLSNIEKIISLPKLISTNWNFWYNSVIQLMLLTETSVVFLQNPPSTTATI
ncbi:hypothetical protein EPUL_006539, partial [Erysiphe pulchra]